jgi:hypothetical protein
MPIRSPWPKRLKNPVCRSLLLPPNTQRPLQHYRPTQFDRLLLAQAFMEPLRLVTADETLLAYGGGIELI